MFPLFCLRVCVDWIYPGPSSCPQRSCVKLCAVCPPSARSPWLVCLVTDVWSARLPTTAVFCATSMYPAVISFPLLRYFLLEVAPSAHHLLVLQAHLLAAPLHLHLLVPLSPLPPRPPSLHPCLLSRSPVYWLWILGLGKKMETMRWLQPTYYSLCLGWREWPWRALPRPAVSLSTESLSRQRSSVTEKEFRG